MASRTSANDKFPNFLNTNDEIRFRFYAFVNSRLHVLNRSRAIRALWLYLTKKTTSANKLELGLRLVIPDLKGGYSIAGPPAFDVTYWILTPMPLRVIPGVSAEFRTTSTLIPRSGGTLL